MCVCVCVSVCVCSCRCGVLRARTVAQYTVLFLCAHCTRAAVIAISLLHACMNAYSLKCASVCLCVSHTPQVLIRWSDAQVAGVRGLTLTRHILSCHTCIPSETQTVDGTCVTHTHMHTHTHTHIRTFSCPPMPHQGAQHMFCVTSTNTAQTAAIIVCPCSTVHVCVHVPMCMSKMCVCMCVCVCVCHSSWSSQTRVTSLTQWTEVCSAPPLSPPRPPTWRVCVPQRWTCPRGCGTYTVRRWCTGI